MIFFKVEHTEGAEELYPCSTCLKSHFSADSDYQKKKIGFWVHVPPLMHSRLKSGKICNFGKPHFLPQRPKSTVFFKKKLMKIFHPEGACGVKIIFK